RLFLMLSLNDALPIYAAHEAARAGRPGFHGERRAGGPLRTHADAKQRAEQEEQRKIRRDAGKKVTDRVPKNRDHQRSLAPDAIRSEEHTTELQSPCNP